jgi:hypothetical protein
MKKLFSLLLLLLTSPLFADVKVKKEDHIENMDPGRCAWCSLETLGRTHGWTSLEGCRDRNNRAAYREQMTQELDKAKVKYRVHQANQQDKFYHAIYQKTEKSDPVWLYVTKDEKKAKEVINSKNDIGFYWIEKRSHWSLEYLKKAVDDNLGAAVSLDTVHPKDFNPDPKYRHSRHMVVLVGIDDKTVRLVDSNFTQGEIREESLAWFLTRWNGFAIVIEKAK